MKKPMKIFLGVLGVAALIGVCFACLTIYAKNEINKPKFEMPEDRSHDGSADFSGRGI